MRSATRIEASEILHRLCNCDHRVDYLSQASKEDNAKGPPALMAHLAIEALQVRFGTSAIGEKQWNEITESVFSRFPELQQRLDSAAIQKRLCKHVTNSDQYEVTLEDGRKVCPPSTSEISRAVIFCAIHGSGPPKKTAQSCPLFQDFFRSHSSAQRRRWVQADDCSYLDYAWVNIYSLLFSRKYVSNHGNSWLTDFTLPERWGWPGPYTFGELASDVRWYGRSRTLDGVKGTERVISIVVSSTATKLLYSDTLRPAYCDAIENGCRINIFVEKGSHEGNQLCIRAKELRKMLGARFKKSLHLHRVAYRAGSPFSLSMGWIGMHNGTDSCVRIVRELPEEEQRHVSTRRPTVLDAHGSEEKRFWDWHNAVIKARPLEV